MLSTARSHHGLLPDFPEESEMSASRFKLSLCAWVVSPGRGSEPVGPGVPGIKVVSEAVLTAVSLTTSLFDPLVWQELRLATRI